jgi:hypothetical protein
MLLRYVETAREFDRRHFAIRYGSDPVESFANEFEKVCF